MSRLPVCLSLIAVAFACLAGIGWRARGTDARAVVATSAKAAPAEQTAPVKEVQLPGQAAPQAKPVPNLKPQTGLAPKHAAERAPGAEGFTLTADNALASGAPEDALISAQDCLDRFPSSMSCRARLGAALRQLGRYEDMVAALEPCARSADPGSPDIAACLGDLADALEKTGRSDEALETYRRLIDIAIEQGWPGTRIGELQLTLAGLLRDRGDTRLALEQYRRACANGDVEGCTESLRPSVR